VVHLLGQAVWVQHFKGLDNAGMEDALPLLEQPAIGHLVGQGMLEGEFALGEEPRLVEQLRRLQVVKAPGQSLLGHLGNGL
jgi:hypothetical protein